MQKTILFPTDFTVGSLNIVRSVLHQMRSDSRCRILLVHGYRPEDSITGLLFGSRTKWAQTLTNREFEDACEVILNKYESKIVEFRKEVFTGITQAAFNDYAMANGVDEIHLPQVYQLGLISKRSFDIVPFIRNSGLVVNEVKWEDTAHIPEKGMVAEVFNDRIAMQQGPLMQ